MPPNIRVGLLKELRGVQVAQCVRGEVPEQPPAPVDVLQHAVGVAGGTMPKYLRYFSCHAGQVRDLKNVFDRRLSSLKADQDVQVVGRFVRFNTNKQGRNR